MRAWNCPPALVGGLLLVTAGCSVTFPFDREVSELEPGDVVGQTLDGEQGTPLGHTNIQVGGTLRTERSGGDGAFTIPGLYYGGWKLTFAHDDNGDGRSERFATRTAVIDLTPYTDDDGDIEIRPVDLSSVLLLGAGVVRGEVSMSDAVVEGAEVVLVSFYDLNNPLAPAEAFSLNTGIAARAKTDSRGVFFMPDVPAGQYKLFASYQDGDTLEYAEPLEFDLDAGGRYEPTVALTLNTPDDVPAAVVVVDDPPPVGASADVYVFPAGVSPVNLDDRLADYGGEGLTIGDDAQLPLDMPTGQRVDVWIVSGGKQGALFDQLLLPGLDNQILGPTELAPPSPGCVAQPGIAPVADDNVAPERDCDGDGVFGLPRLKRNPDGGLDGFVDVYTQCAGQCGDAFGALASATATCTVDGNVYDCDDDGDGQADTTEPPECLIFGAGGDRDGDGLCDAVDPFPLCDLPLPDDVELCYVFPAPTYEQYLPGATIGDALFGPAAGRDHTCITRVGPVQCWGHNHLGQLGTNSPLPTNGGDEYVSEPAKVVLENQPTTALAARQVAVGDGFSCAATVDGPLACWGDQLITGFEDNLNVARVIAGTAPRTIAAGARHVCFTVNDGTLTCFGENTHGQLGRGNTDPATALAPATLAGTFSALALGANHSCAVADDGLYCWGLNDDGQLGIGSAGQDQLTPTLVSDKLLRVAAGSSHTCAIHVDNGGVYCWGNNADSQLGVAGVPSSNVPVPSGFGQGATAGLQAVAVATGERHSCALTDAGAVWCWGSNSDGQLGDAIPVGSSTATPVQVVIGALAGTGAEAISAGDDHNCATLRTGDFQCWGSDNFDDGGTGQLGQSGTTPKPAGGYRFWRGDAGDVFADRANWQPASAPVTNDIVVVDELSGHLDIDTGNQFGAANPLGGLWSRAGYNGVVTVSDTELALVDWFVLEVGGGSLQAAGTSVVVGQAFGETAPDLPPRAEVRLRTEATLGSLLVHQPGSVGISGTTGNVGALDVIGNGYVALDVQQGAVADLSVQVAADGIDQDFSSQCPSDRPFCGVCPAGGLCVDISGPSEVGAVSFDNPTAGFMGIASFLPGGTTLRAQSLSFGAGTGEIDIGTDGDETGVAPLGLIVADATLGDNVSVINPLVFDADGTFTQNGGALNAPAEVNPGVTTDLAPGQTTSADFVVAGTLNVGAGATWQPVASQLSATGTVAVAGTVTGDLSVAGTLSVGPGGTWTVTNSDIASGGTLALAGGTVGGESLTVAGDVAHASGSLSVAQVVFTGTGSATNTGAPTNTASFIADQFLAADATSFGAPATLRFKSALSLPPSFEHNNGLVAHDPLDAAGTATVFIPGKAVLHDFTFDVPAQQPNTTLEFASQPDQCAGLYLGRSTDFVVDGTLILRGDPGRPLPVVGTGYNPFGQPGELPWYLAPTANTVLDTANLRDLSVSSSGTNPNMFRTIPAILPAGVSPPTGWNETCGDTIVQTGLGEECEGVGAGCDAATCRWFPRSPHTWSGAIDDDWTKPGNWLTGGEPASTAPGIGNDCVFPSTASGIVRVPAFAFAACSIPIFDAGSNVTIRVEDGAYLNLSSGYRGDAAGFELLGSSILQTQNSFVGGGEFTMGPDATLRLGSFNQSGGAWFRSNFQNPEGTVLLTPTFRELVAEDGARLPRLTSTQDMSGNFNRYIGGNVTVSSLDLRNDDFLGNGLYFYAARPGSRIISLGDASLSGDQANFATLWINLPIEVRGNFSITPYVNYYDELALRPAAPLVPTVDLPGYFNVSRLVVDAPMTVASGTLAADTLVVEGGDHLLDDTNLTAQSNLVVHGGHVKYESPYGLLGCVRIDQQGQLTGAGPGSFEVSVLEVKDNGRLAAPAHITLGKGITIDPTASFDHRCGDIYMTGYGEVNSDGNMYIDAPGKTFYDISLYSDDGVNELAISGVTDGPSIIGTFRYTDTLFGLVKSGNPDGSPAFVDVRGTPDVNIPNVSDVANIGPGYVGAVTTASNADGWNVPPECGDGAFDPAREECDDGNNNDDDGCSRACTLGLGWVADATGAPTFQGVCGNGIIEVLNPDLGEFCDDGNTQDGDGCSSSCTVEFTYTCTGCGPGSCYNQQGG